MLVALKKSHLFASSLPYLLVVGEGLLGIDAAGLAHLDLGLGEGDGVLARGGDLEHALVVAGDLLLVGRRDARLGHLQAGRGALALLLLDRHLDHRDELRVRRGRHAHLEHAHGLDHGAHVDGLR
jgi:hypothetical protein